MAPSLQYDVLLDFDPSVPYGMLLDFDFDPSLPYDMLFDFDPSRPYGGIFDLPVGESVYRTDDGLRMGFLVDSFPLSSTSPTSS